MLVGRGTELERLDVLLRDALAGRAGSLVLTGDPGVGKTALLQEVTDRARGLGLSVVRVSGVQSERDLPYAGLHSLLSPLLHSASPTLTTAQQRALRVALGEWEGPAPGRLLLGSAVLSVLGSSGPLLVAVDDLPWLDPPSADALTFAARRLLAENVALLATSRTNGLADPLSPAAGLPTLSVGGIMDAALLLPQVHRTVARRLAEACGGNPLAMIESAARLSPAEAAGDVPLRQPLPDSAPERLYEQELGGLSDRQRDALRVLALGGSAPQGVLLAALDLAGLDRTDLAPLTERRLGEFARTGVRWRHPLARSAAARGTPEQTRSAHSALAVAWGSGASARSAWHLAEAASGTDPEAADAMAMAAAAADARSASADAADAWECAARLSPDPATATTWLEQAGVAALRAGATRRASRLLDEALQHQPGPEQAAALMRRRGRIEHALGAPDRALQLFLQSLDLTQDRRLKVWAAAEGLFDAMYAAHPQDAARMATLARTHHDPTDPVQCFLVAHAAGAAAALAGDLDAARNHMGQARELMSQGSLLRTEPDLLPWAVTTDIFDQRPGEPDADVLAVIDDARRAEDLAVLPRALRLIGVRHLDGGHPGAAAGFMEEAELLSRASGQITQLAEALVQLGRLDAYQGRHDAARRRADEAESLLAGLGLAWLECGIADLRALDALTRDDLTEALPQLVEAVAGDPFAAVLLADALVRSAGRHAARRDLVLATHLPPDLESAVTAVLGDDDVASGDVLSTVASARPRVTQAAHLRVLAGQRLRRGGRRREARVELRRAREVFSAMSAEPWVARIDAELRASGATLRRTDETISLTPSEQRVAQLAATGLSNKDIAADLYLSPKTVEFHLGHIFRKLDVSNRTSLARVLADHPAG